MALLLQNNNTLKIDFKIFYDKKRLFYPSPYRPFYTRTSTGVVKPVAEMQRDLE